MKILIKVLARSSCDSFQFLGVIAAKDGKSEKGNAIKIAQGKRSFHQINSTVLWNNEVMNTIKADMYKPILTSLRKRGSEIWKMNEKDKLIYLEMDYWRRNCRIYERATMSGTTELGSER